MPPLSPLAMLAYDHTMPVGTTGVWETSPSPRRSKPCSILCPWQSDIVLTNSLLGTVVPMDASSLADCSIPTFNPRRPTYTCFDLLMRLGSNWGWTVGINRTEMKQIFKACVLCQRYMYAERRAQHRCEAQGLQGVHSPEFDFLAKMLSFDVHSGMSSAELISLLSRCDDCGRVVHASPGSDLDPDSIFYPHRCP